MLSPLARRGCTQSLANSSMIAGIAKHMSLHVGLWAAGCVLLLGGICILDGLLPTRSGGPNPSWTEVFIGSVVVACSWYIRVSFMRAMARERQSMLMASVAPHAGQPFAPHEPPPRVSVSGAADNRRLDSPPAPGSGGGR
jgi:hypothetical protein